jgi:hypothetical protein
MNLEVLLRGSNVLEQFVVVLGRRRSTQLGVHSTDSAFVHPDFL